MRAAIFPFEPAERMSAFIKSRGFKGDAFGAETKGVGNAGSLPVALIANKMPAGLRSTRMILCFLSNKTVCCFVVSAMPTGNIFACTMR